jgi:hypothetical protein
MFQHYILYLFSGVFSMVCFGQQWNTIGAGVPQPNITMFDQYGYSISIDGDIAVIGAPGNDDQNVNAGKAFVYEKINGQWELVSELFLDHADAEVQFGKSVLIKDRLILVGVPGLNGFGVPEEGGVIVYKKIENNWVYINELRMEYPSAYDHLGASLAMHNGTVAVGAPGSTNIIENSGSVYIFKNIETNVFPVAEIPVPASETVYKFGVSVALNGDDLFVGDIRSHVDNISKGAVFVFDLDSYALKAKLTTNRNIFNFGSTLAATSNTLAVSSWGSNTNNSYGTVFIFDKPVGDWTNTTENASRIPSNGDEYGIYGSSIYLNDETLVIGSNGGTVVDFFEKPVNGWSNLGEPFVLKNDSFTFLQKYGFSLAVSGTDVIIGAYNWNVPGEYSGAAFVYEKSSQSWNSLVEKEILKGLSFNASSFKLGFSVDIDGNYAVAGAPYDDTFGESSGAAYVFKFNGTSWERIAKLTPSDGNEYDYFGWSVAINGNTIVISAYNAERTNENGINSTGKVYVFEKPSGEWTSSHEDTQIPRKSNSHRGSFGHDVDIDQNEIIISHFDGGSSDEIALVYIFTRNGTGWLQKAKLSPSLISFRQFGATVVMKDNLVAIGAPISENFNGSVLLFEKPASGWVDAVESAVLRPSDERINGYFGTSIDIHGNTILVGSQQVYTGSAGAAYIFEKNIIWKNATENAILAPQSEVNGSRYGASVALGADFAVMSSYTINSESGRALFFKKIDGIWKNTTEYFFAGSFGEGDQFGYNLAVYNDFLIVGAPGASSTSGSESGSVYFYLKEPTVNEVNSLSSDGTYKVNEKIQIKVVFSQPIVTSGNPTLQLLLKNNVTRNLSLKNLTSDQELNFEYIVTEGDFSDDLDYLNSQALQVSPGHILSKLNGVTAIKDLPVPGSPNSLSGLRDLVIDGSVVVGIENDEDSSVNAYPNPFTSGFQINLNEDVSVKLISSSGVHVFEGELPPGAIFSPNIQQGIYVLDISTKSGLKRRIRLIKI